jgi:hypothetical protein
MRRLLIRLLLRLLSNGQPSSEVVFEVKQPAPKTWEGYWHRGY